MELAFFRRDSQLQQAGQLEELSPRWRVHIREWKLGFFEREHLCTWTLNYAAGLARGLALNLSTCLQTMSLAIDRQDSLMNKQTVQETD